MASGEKVDLGDAGFSSGSAERLLYAATFRSGPVLGSPRGALGLWGVWALWGFLEGATLVAGAVTEFWRTGRLWAMAALSLAQNGLLQIREGSECASHAGGLGCHPGRSLNSCVP